MYTMHHCDKRNLFFTYPFVRVVVEVEQERVVCSRLVVALVVASRAVAGGAQGVVQNILGWVKTKPPCAPV